MQANCLIFDRKEVTLFQKGDTFTAINHGSDYIYSRYPNYFF